MIVGEDLWNLIKNNKICDEKYYDNTCIGLALDENIIKYNENIDCIEYGKSIPESYIVRGKIGNNGIIIKKGECLLACSSEKIKMPNGYFGLLQTKGSLARLFVQLHCSDGQIDPGFEGKVTFEIVNFSNFDVKINKGQLVGNLYIFKTSNDDADGYSGKYSNWDMPTFYMK